MKKLFKSQIGKTITSVDEVQVLGKMDEVDFVAEQTKQEERKPLAVVEILDAHDKSMQSPISKLARWVSQYAWYKHLLVFGVVIAVAAIIGAILQAALLWTIAVAILYFTTVGLLRYHHYCEERRVKSNTEMAAYAQAKLHEGIEDVKEVGHELDALSSDLGDASRTMEGFGQDFAAQSKKQDEQTRATEALNLNIYQTHTALEESRHALDKAQGEIETVCVRLADNISHLGEVEQSVTNSSFAIEQTASMSTVTHEVLAQDVNALDTMVGTLKENASTGILLFDRVRQSTIELAETMSETAQSRVQLNTTLEHSSELIQSSTELIEGFSQYRQQAKDDQRCYEECMKVMEASDQAFQLALAVLPTERSAHEPIQLACKGS